MAANFFMTRYFFLRKPALHRALAVLLGSAPLILAGCNASDSSPEANAREQELQQLRGQNEELQRLLAENQELPRARRDNEELKRLRGETAALEELRQENARLHAELESAKAARTRPPARK
jgi:hypothetical protein